MGPSILFALVIIGIGAVVLFLVIGIFNNLQRKRIAAQNSSSFDLKR